MFQYLLPAIFQRWLSREIPGVMNHLQFPEDVSTRQKRHGEGLVQGSDIQKYGERLKILRFNALKAEGKNLRPLAEETRPKLNESSGLSTYLPREYLRPTTHQHISSQTNRVAYWIQISVTKRGADWLVTILPYMVKGLNRTQMIKRYRLLSYSDSLHIITNCNSQ